MSAFKRSRTTTVEIVKAQTKPTTVKHKARNPSLRSPFAMVTILVGKDDADIKKFVVHRDFATHHSPVFEAAFKSQFIEGQTQTYKLEETSEEAVRLLVHWLYTLELDCVALRARTDRYIGRAKYNLALAELWVLADKLLIPQLQNQVIRRIAEDEEATMTAYETFDYVYENTSDGSELRKLMVYQCIWSGLHEISWLMKYFPKEMLWDIFSGLVKLRPSERPVMTLSEFEVKTVKNIDMAEPSKINSPSSSGLLGPLSLSSDSFEDSL